MRTLVMDTESTDLKAIMGRLLCASFAYMTVNSKGEAKVGKPWTLDIEAHPGESVIDDSRLAVQIRDTLESADMFVGWNSKLHDIPLLNARLALAGERQVHVRLHADLMWYAAGSSMKIGSRKLDNVAKFFELKSQKTPLDWPTWQKAGAGDTTALKEVVKHCEYDVRVLGEAFPHLIPFVRTIHR
jgi:uncharacterized protein YprB with RNaseH-like and TPR domain